MQISFDLADLEELVLESKFNPSIPSKDLNLHGYDISSPVLQMQGSIKELFFENLHIAYGTIQLGTPTLLHFEIENESVEMHFALGGYSNTQLDQSTSDILLLPFQHNIFYNPYQKGTTRWSDGTCQVFEVNFLTDFLLQYLPDNHQLFEGFIKSIQKSQSSPISQYNYPITPEMYGIIRKIITCNRTGHFKKMFVESSVLELLMLQLEQITNSPNNPVTISRKNQEKIHAVRELLDREFHQTYSLNTLAKRVGTNDFMLKKGFKELFGTTVFGYLNQLKMIHAEELLLEGGLSVAEVGERVGFTNSQSFCSAFKRNFGYAPSKIRG